MTIVNSHITKTNRNTPAPVAFMVDVTLSGFAVAVCLPHYMFASIVVKGLHEWQRLGVSGTAAVGRKADLSLTPQ